MRRITRGKNQAARTEPIPLTRSTVHEDDIRALEMASRGDGADLEHARERLEERLREFTGRAHAIATHAGTVAVEIALWALALHERDKHRDEHQERHAPFEVRLPVAGCSAAASATARVGGRIEPVDITADTWTLDHAALERTLAQRRPGDRACVVMHEDLHGVVVDISQSLHAAHAHGAHLIRDASGALGGFAASGASVTSQADVVVLSLGPRDDTTLSTGAILCDDRELAERMRTLTNLGRPPGQDEIVTPGTDARLSDVVACLALTRLERVHAAVNERRLLVRGYHERLAHLAERGALRWQSAPEDSHPACAGFAILLAENLPERASRENVRQHLAARHIETGPAALALHRMTGFAHLPGLAGREFPVAQALHDRGLSLPLFPGMRSAQLDRVCDALSEALS